MEFEDFKTKYKLLVQTKDPKTKKAEFRWLTGFLSDNMGEPREYTHNPYENNGIWYHSYPNEAIVALRKVTCLTDRIFVLELRLGEVFLVHQAKAEKKKQIEVSTHQVDMPIKAFSVRHGEDVSHWKKENK